MNHYAGFDWQDLLFGSQPASFTYAIILRAAVMFAVVMAALFLLGKRGVSQLSVFELVIILTLGSAAGDPMLYNEVGLLTCITVFIVIICLYRLTIYLSTRNLWFEQFIKGKPVYLIEDGKFCNAIFKKQSLGFPEFFAELRIQGVSQLGQVKASILETSGNISLFYFEDDEVRPGLPIMPAALINAQDVITEEGLYACLQCAETGMLKPGKHICNTCNGDKWLKVSKERRVQ